MTCDQMRRLTQVAVEGFEVVLDFQGKTYVLCFAGDTQGIFEAKHVPNHADSTDQE